MNPTEACLYAEVGANLRLFASDDKVLLQGLIRARTSYVPEDETTFTDLDSPLTKQHVHKSSSLPLAGW